MPKKRKKQDYAIPALPGPGAKLQRDGTWLEPQPNGGYLKRDGAPSGPPPAELRKRMRGHVSEKMHVAAAILGSEEATNRDKLSALELLAKYGLGQRSEKFDPALVKALALSVQAEVEDEAVLRRIERRWADVLRDHVVGG